MTIRTSQAGDDFLAKHGHTLIAAAGAAPSSHNTQPWQFRLTNTSIEVYADSKRALAVADPDQRELRMACGAALFNLRMAMWALGREPHVDLNSTGRDSDFIGQVDVGRVGPCPPWAATLARAISRRHTHREPFFDAPVPQGVRAQLIDAAAHEGALLVLDDQPATLTTVAQLVHHAHTRQMTNPAFVAEWQSWTGNHAGRTDGVPAIAGGPRPEPNDILTLRDFSVGTRKRGAAQYESAPLLGILATPTNRKFDDIAAGQAMERVLLLATSLGLASSFLAQPVEVPEIREQLAGLIREMFYQPYEPRMVLRFGYGTGGGRTTPRRPVEDVLISQIPTSQVSVTA